MWHAGRVSRAEDLVPAWLTVPEVADRLGVPVTAVRRLIEDRALLGLRVGTRRVLAVPEGFLGEDGPLPALRGTVTVLADSGLDDEEAIAWLFEPDPSLPVQGAPVDALRAGFTTEVRRRAMELAW